MKNMYQSPVVELRMFAQEDIVRTSFRLDGDNDLVFSEGI